MSCFGRRNRCIGEAFLSDRLSIDEPLRNSSAASVSIFLGVSHQIQSSDSQVVMGLHNFGFSDPISMI